MMRKSTTAIGRWAEQQVAMYLQTRGVNVVVQNYRCREGEIDFVGFHEDTLIFVEVRYRKDDFYGTGAESIDSRKQQRIFITAQHFLQQHPQWQNVPCRFDAVLVSPPKTAPQIDWITDAFQGDSFI